MVLSCFPPSLPLFLIPRPHVYQKRVPRLSLRAAQASCYIIHVWILDAMTSRMCCYGLQDHKKQTSPETYTCQYHRSYMVNTTHGTETGYAQEELKRPIQIKTYSISHSQGRQHQLHNTAVEWTVVMVIYSTVWLLRF